MGVDALSPHYAADPSHNDRDQPIVTTILAVEATVLKTPTMEPHKVAARKIT